MHSHFQAATCGRLDRSPGRGRGGAAHPGCVFIGSQDVEANTVRLEEHGHTVLVLEKSTTDSTDQGGAGGSSK